ncbi:hypothetical protein [Caulobacter sp. S45]|uniref:hypothetical protein n=1 Tax=Caulobacter sp. S45 TaxID=1641861 RepID=UPI00131C9689|nr:hypothetical protein [Caulobacter sp. S45]
MLRLLRDVASRLIRRRRRAGVSARDLQSDASPLAQEAYPFIATAPRRKTDLPLQKHEVLRDGLEEEEDEDEAAGEDGEEASEDGAGDPFISLVPESAPRKAPALTEMRAAARLQGLSGEHKIYLFTMAGPGSLAEALIHLLDEGRVIAEFVDRPEEEPHLLYRPKAR